MERSDRAGHAVLLRDFVNTLDLEAGTDALSTPADLAAWLRDRELVPAGTRAGRADLTRAHRLRAALRAAMAASGPAGPEAVSADPDLDLDRVFGELPLRVRPGAPPRLEPNVAGTRGGLAWIAAAVATSAADGSWPRLKICTDDTCQWAFIDESRNRSRHWCSMSVCGNRTKTRAYRARLRSAHSANPGETTPPGGRRGDGR